MAGGKEMTIILANCGTCKYWQQGLYSIVGECALEMESKTADDTCAGWIEREAPHDK
jgi:hypothetical protein